MRRILLHASMFSIFVTFVMPGPMLGQRTEAKSNQSSEDAKRAESLFQEALNLTETKKPEFARKQFEDALAIWTRIGETDKAAYASIKLGDVFRDGTKFQEALRYFKRALEIGPISPAASASVYDSIGRIYSDMHQRDLALDYYDKALKSSSSQKDILIRARVMCDRAELFYKFGEAEQASAVIIQANDIGRRTGDGNIEAASLYLLGRIALSSGKLVDAKKDLEHALTIYVNLNDVEGQIGVLCSLSEISLSGKQSQLAVDQATRAKGLADKLFMASKPNKKTRAKGFRWQTSLSLARAQRNIGHLKEAKSAYLHSVSDIENLLLAGYRVTDDSAIGFGENRRSAYSGIIDLSMEENNTTEAYQDSQQYRCRSLLELMRSRRSKDAGKTNEQKNEIRQLSGVIADLRTKLLFSRTDATIVAELRRAIDETEVALIETRLAAEMSGPGKNLSWADPVSIKDLQEKLVHDNSLNNASVLEFFLGDDHSYAWLISATEVTTEVLPGRKDIEKTVDQYLQTLTTPPNAYSLGSGLSKVKEQGKELFSKFLGKLGDKLAPGKKLIIIPDGMLYYLPFEALIRNDRYLIEDHVISYLPSAALIDLLQDSKNRKADDDRMELLAFGDPDFGPWSRPSTLRGLKLSDVFRGAKNLQDVQLTPLPKSREEVRSISGRFPADRVHSYLGKDSTEDNLKRELLRRYKRIHFATHSLVDDTNPAQSSVVLTLDADPQEDGFLEVSEIMDLELDCDLVVLSACQTGRGKLFSGEGIVGLSRAFLYAGARSVAVSLWDVNDSSTGQLMKSFYGQLKGDTGNAAALREAKLEMLRSDNQWQHPFFWAPFVLVGNH